LRETRHCRVSLKKFRVLFNSHSLADYWQRSLVEFKANLPYYGITVRVAPEAMPWLRYAGYFSRIEQIHPPDVDGWIPIAMRFDIEKAASIGGDVGLLPAPVLQTELIIAPAERFDVVIDFSRYAIGTQVILKNLDGNGTTSQVMHFDVVRSQRDDSR
jgi:hypothetical protein